MSGTTILTSLVAIFGVWSAWSLIRGLWSIFLPRSAWKWDRGAEIKGAEPSMLGLVAQFFRGLRYLATAAVTGIVAWVFYTWAYPDGPAMRWPWQ